MTRAEAIKLLSQMFLIQFTAEEHNALGMAIDALQAEPKHGKWKYYNYSDVSNPYQGYFICSVCGEYEHTKHKFCPNCGAKMDKE